MIPNLVGNLPDWDDIARIAEAHGLPVIEDSSDVLDSRLRGERTGTRVPITVTSFARSHAMTCAGMGGMVAMDDDEWFDRTLVRRRWGRRSESYLYGTKQGAERFGSLDDGTPYDFVFVFDDTGYNFEPYRWWSEEELERAEVEAPAIQRAWEERGVEYRPTFWVHAPLDEASAGT